MYWSSRPSIFGLFFNCVTLLLNICELAVLSKPSTFFLLFMGDTSDLTFMEADRLMPLLPPGPPPPIDNLFLIFFYIISISKASVPKTLKKKSEFRLEDVVSHAPGSHFPSQGHLP